MVVQENAFTQKGKNKNKKKTQTNQNETHHLKGRVPLIAKARQNTKKYAILRRKIKKQVTKCVMQEKQINKP